MARHPLIRSIRFPALLIIAGSIPVSIVRASPEGQVAAAYVRADTYREILDNWLYTHDGDDRGYGPEHDMARDNIADLFSTYGLTVTLEPFEYPVDSGEIYYNVVGTKIGTHYPDEVFVLGAHYDSVGNPGADDNASGTALVLEAARVIAPFPSDYTIRFVAFDREEQGLIGSYAYVEAHFEDDIYGMISADMVAFNTGENRAEIFGRTVSAALRSAIGEAVTEYGDGLIAGLMGGSGGSDHLPFELAGIPACLFIEDWGNPNYHTFADSVDTPDYIDYNYAARMTKSIVGFLVDIAGVDVDLPDADYDGDGLVGPSDFEVFSTCYSGEDNPPTVECALFDLDGDNDVDCGDWSLFEVLWTAPGEPPTFWNCVLMPPVVDIPGARCLAVDAPAHGLPLAISVQGNASDSRVACVSAYVQANGTLGLSPVYRTFAEWGRVNICDDEIIPQASYEVTCVYGEGSAASYSEAIHVTTPLFGDTVGVFAEGNWTPSNTIVDISDAVAALDRFKNAPSAPPLVWVDIIRAGSSGMTCGTDGIVDILDVLAVLNAFRGRTFLEYPDCALPCP